MSYPVRFGTAFTTTWERHAIAIKGLVTMLLGVVFLAWPPERAGELSALFGVLSLVLAASDIARAVLARHAEAEVRLLFLLLGLLLAGAGVLGLRDELGTAGVLSIMFGMTWLLTGLADLVDLVMGPFRSGRGPGMALAVVTALAGMSALVPSSRSLPTLSLAGGFWLVAWGGLTAILASSAHSASQWHR
ncbi:DUF308 domain-containing protein [Spongiactinospora sp. TRM90649]|uniref:DUF308 domain-containing protein n=1 Tax=Spongiactinospora sp. TRM90649 TaxID=3031114 RepID=UPI0023FA3980|nr:DUF308 domain-containing protein [Spongiactinospora sp. TRM90649]MDF5756912.1 DUF308 domain-containing protein [Spongiactinospora sp. TRM90649]